MFAHREIRGPARARSLVSRLFDSFAQNRALREAVHYTLKHSKRFKVPFSRGQTPASMGPGRNKMLLRVFLVTQTSDHGILHSLFAAMFKSGSLIELVPTTDNRLFGFGTVFQSFHVIVPMFSCSLGIQGLRIVFLVGNTTAELGYEATSAILGTIYKELKLVPITATRFPVRSRSRDQFADWARIPLKTWQGPLCSTDNFILLVANQLVICKDLASFMSCEKATSAYADMNDSDWPRVALWRVRDIHIKTKLPCRESW
ncbi:uncharacterized protein BDR25DRAFT_357483 [Lindgomyces ingoldianus]|uniref:Uncharacterized protein n=1 Tax=Lindgomyces ingoldianus TaxID=673940 RepID=A0ACB6QR47_9PLEO|nr:uncharacterized protein BDR25DRAFT_357483 [Lindgomyces ingoldianus]KAF2468560.1 hypothetical protein BDR25DRAFT_357483 [Lindgomyces ingoldianus]